VRLPARVWLPDLRTVASTLSVAYSSQITLGTNCTADDMTTLRWVKLRFVVEVSFAEWTAGANLRHAAFLGLRDDQPVNTVRRET